MTRIPSTVFHQTRSQCRGHMRNTIQKFLAFAIVLSSAFIATAMFSGSADAFCKSAGYNSWNTWTINRTYGSETGAFYGYEYITGNRYEISTCDNDGYYLGYVRDHPTIMDGQCAKIFRMSYGSDNGTAIAYACNASWKRYDLNYAYSYRGKICKGNDQSICTWGSYQGA